MVPELWPQDFSTGGASTRNLWFQQRYPEGCMLDTNLGCKLSA